MHDPCAQDESSALTDQLQQQAAQQRPSFSEPLHARIMAAVGGADRNDAPTPRTVPRRRTIACVTSLGAIATTLAVCWLLLLGPLSPAVVTEIDPPNSDEPWLTSGESDAQTGRDLPDVASLAPQVQDLLDPVAADQGIVRLEQSLTAGEWDNLNHDLQLATRMLEGHLPFELAVTE